MNKFFAILMGVLLLANFSFATKCLVDSDCGGSDVCILNGCYTPEECSTSADCDFKDQCIRGACISISCRVTSECPTDFMCDDGKCTPFECTDDSYCKEGFECMNYKCRELPPTSAGTPEGKPETVSVSSPPSSAPTTTTTTTPAPVTACPDRKCPVAQPTQNASWDLGLPILILVALIGAAIGFFAAKFKTDESGENADKPKEKPQSGETGGEIDYDDEGSYRYI